MKLRLRVVVSGGIALGVLGSPALAHVFTNEEGVHFKDPKIDFGAPPTRYSLEPGDDPMMGVAYRPGTTYLLYKEDQVPAPSPKLLPLLKQTASLEAQGKFRAALDKWRWAWTHGIGDPTPVRERIELLSVLVSHPHEKGGRELLEATSELHPSELPPFESLGKAIQPFGLYRSIDRKKGSALVKATAYSNLSDRYPHSPVTEAALISVPRLLLRRVNPAPDAGAITLSLSALDRLSTNYPRGRFRPDVVGWRGRLAFIKKDLPGAIKEYQRQFELSEGSVAKAKALRSMGLCQKYLDQNYLEAATRLRIYGLSKSIRTKTEGGIGLEAKLERFTGQDARLFWKELAKDPQLLSFYLDYRVEASKPSRELITLTLPVHGSSYQPHILARLAHIAFLFKEDKLAKRYATRSLRQARAKDDKALDLYLLGSVAKRQAAYGEATRHYEALLRDCPNSYLCGGARENLALLYERSGRMGKALDIYSKLGYAFDVAYIIDVRMTVPQLAAYVASHRHDDSKGILRFSLGVRYLRSDRWGLAMKELHSLSYKERKSLRRLDYNSDSDDSPSYVQDPLKTAEDLAHLYRAYAKARGYNSRANALTQVADYYYDNRNLLLYNATLWSGMREQAIAYGWNPLTSTDQDSKALEDYHWQHECLARAYAICQDVRHKFPRAKIRYRVAYREACAAERLANFNTWWRWEGHRHSLISKSIDLMKYAATSPDKELAFMAEKYQGVFGGYRDTDVANFKEARKEEKENRQWHRDPNSGWMESNY